MALSTAFASRSGGLSNPAPPTTGDGPSAARALRSHQVLASRNAGSVAPSRLQSPEASVPRASSRSSSRIQAVEESSSSAPPVAAAATEEEVKGRVGRGGECPGCGKAEKVGGCNGEGRIQGGIGVVPGFGWWPIKAFRPCPAFVEAGGRYRRIGQSLEEVAFGRKGMADDLDVSERLKG